MGKRVLVIASYYGEDRHNPYNYLNPQLESLGRLKHSLDDVVVVVNEGQATEDYLRSLDEFSKVLYRPNVCGSYGAWNFAWETYGDKYEWYFYLEDDYVFNMDNFDDKLIAMWEPEMGHLCSYQVIHPVYGWHMAMVNGLISADGWRAADFSHFNTLKSRPAYDSEIQVHWGNAFIRSSLAVKSIVPTYNTPFYGAGVTRSWCDAPAIITPAQQTILPYPRISNPRKTRAPRREVAEDRHQQRLKEDPVYMKYFSSRI